MRRLAGIQYARAAAALAVVAYHACARRGLAFPAGAAGVDIFFVISGFVIWTSTQDATPTLRDYAWRRIARIVPLYWVATLALAGAALLRPALVPHLRPSLATMAMSLGFVPFRDADGQIFPLLAPGWTLNYEMFFYALFGLALLIVRRHRLAALLTGLLALVAAGLAVGPRGAVAVTYTSPLLLEFGAGMVLGRLWQAGIFSPAGLVHQGGPASRRGPGPGVAGGQSGRLRQSRAGWQRLAGWQAMAGWPLIGLGLALIVVEGGATGSRLLGWGGPAVLIVSGILALEGAGAMPPWRLGVQLGDASYSIYLLHPLLISGLLRVPGLPTVWLVIGSIGLAALVGLGSFAWFERPVARALVRRMTAPRAAVPIPPGGRFAALDAVRGVAAVAVLMAHSAALFRPVWMRSAYLAVDLFFVLSGFVLAHAYGTRLRSTAFLQLRVRRLMPLYLLGSAIALLGALLQGGWSHAALLRAALAAAVLAPLPPLAGAPNGYAFPLNAPGWTLFFELAVNALYAVIGPGLSGRRLGWLLAASLAGLVVSGWWFGSLDVGTRFGTLWAGATRCTFLFFLGVALHRWHDAGGWRPVWFNPWIVLPGLLALFWVPVPAGWRVGFDLLCSIVVLPAVVLAASRAAPLRADLARLCGWLGGVSFALYAIHVPLLGLVEGVLVSRGLGPAWRAPYSGVLFLLVAGVAGWAADRWFDRPVQAWLRRDDGWRAAPKLAVPR